MIRQTTNNHTTKEPSNVFFTAVETLAQSVSVTNLQLSKRRIINFDTKSANILVDRFFHEDPTRTPMTTACDFDHVHCQFVPDYNFVEVHLLNTLLTLTHVRAFSDPIFADAFIGQFAADVFRLLDARSKKPMEPNFLDRARLIRSENGRFDQAKLNATKNDEDRLGAHFSMMIYEYLFSSSRFMRAHRWPGWPQDSTTGFFDQTSPALLPHLVKFIFFFSSPVPTRYKKYVSQ